MGRIDPEGPRLAPWQREAIPQRRRPARNVEHGSPATVGPRPAAAEVVQPYTSTGRDDAGDDAETPRETRAVVEHSTPLWRLVAVVLGFAALGVLGWYFNVQGLAQDAATLVSMTLVGMILYWARRQRVRFAERLGPFGKIGLAILDSRDDLNRWVDARPVWAAFLVALAGATAYTVFRHIVAALIGWMASPWLAVAFGCAVGAAVVAPELWRDAGRRLAGQKA